MARLPDRIRDIDGTKETLKLAVRITDLWFVGIWDKSEQAEMVVIDSNSDKIHVVIRKDQLKSWKSILKEGATYMMHNFKVIKNEGQYRVCLHPFKLIFTGVTVIREAELSAIPFKRYEFIEFENIIAGNFDRGLFVDVIGFVNELTFQHVGAENTRCVFTLKDLRGESVTCTLWEEYCLKFLAYLKESNNAGPIVIVLTHARIKEPQGAYPPAVNNSLRASKLLINEQIPEINEFLQRLNELNMVIQPVLTAYGQGNSQVSGSSQYSEKDKFFYKAEVKSLSEINSISDEVVCVTVGTIGMIVVDNYGWCYASCVQCNKSAGTDDAGFTCKCGKYNKEPLLRYRVEVMVFNKEQSAKFLLWDRECMELIGQPASEVNKLKIEGGDDILNISPEALDNMLGRTLAFKVKTQPKYKNSSVSKISHDKELIQNILDLLSDAEDVGTSASKGIDAVSLPADTVVSVAAYTQDPDKIDVSIVDATHSAAKGKGLYYSDNAQGIDAISLAANTAVSVAAYTQDPDKIDVSIADATHSAAKGKGLYYSDNAQKFVSISADHDPSISLPATPIKRQSLDSSGSDGVAEEQPPTQMSTNKMTKRIKEE